MSETERVHIKNLGTAIHSAYQEMRKHAESLERDLAAERAERDEIKRIALSDDGAGGDGMRLHLENRRLKADLSEALAQLRAICEAHRTGAMGVLEDAVRVGHALLAKERA